MKVDSNIMLFLGAKLPGPGGYVWFRFLTESCELCWIAMSPFHTSSMTFEVLFEAKLESA